MMLPRRFTRTFTRPRLLVATLGIVALPLLLVGCQEPESDVGERIMNTTATEPAATEAPTEAAEETPAAPATPADGAIALEMQDISFSLEAIQTAAEPLTLDIENVGALEHDFTIEDGEFTDVSADGGTDESGAEYAIHFVLAGGESGAITFTPAEAGEYTFFCSVPGHREAGMEGTLTVQ